jgi:hypothetical protein
MTYVCETIRSRCCSGETLEKTLRTCTRGTEVCPCPRCWAQAPLAWYLQPAGITHGGEYRVKVCKACADQLGAIVAL